MGKLNDLIPEKIFKVTNADGSKSRVTQWDSSQAGAWGPLISSGVATFFISGLLMCISGPFILLVNFIFYYWYVTYRGFPTLINVIAILSGGLFILGFTNHWDVITTFYHIFFNDKTINFLINLNIGCLWANVVMLVVSYFPNKQFNLFVVLVPILVFVGFVISDDSTITKHSSVPVAEKPFKPFGVIGTDNEGHELLISRGGTAYWVDRNDNETWIRSAPEETEPRMIGKDLNGNNLFVNQDDNIFRLDKDGDIIIIDFEE